MKAKLKPVLTIESAVLAGMLALGVAAGGCDKKEPATPAVPKPPAPDVTPKATTGGASASNGSAAGAGGASVTSTPTTRPTTQAASSAAKPGTPTIDAPLVTSAESAKHSKEAQDLVAKAMQALKDGRFDESKTALDKVDAMGKDVPPETRELATTTREALKKAQTLQKAPELPAGEGPNK